MRVLIAGDFSGPDFKNVGSTYVAVHNKLNEIGHISVFCGPEQSNGKKERIETVINSFHPDYIHVATNGDFGTKVRETCLKMKLDYTAACFSATVLPKNKKRARFFNNDKKSVFEDAFQVLAATSKINELLKQNGHRASKWIPGIDTGFFKPGSREIFARKKPILLYIDQGGSENSVKSFLDLKNEGTKVVVGSGDTIEKLKGRYQDVFFAGNKKGRELVDIYSSSDVLVIPEKELFFSNTVLEVLSCGTPVATVSENFASEIINGTGAGSISDNLEEAVINALKSQRDACRAVAMNYSLENSARSFMHSQTIADF
jgi:glycosyltransferase involved in cell wall biosynthesis